MSRLVLISGPLQCGKSTAGRAIAAAFGGDHFAVSDRLKHETHSYYGLPASLAVDHFESRKDTPCPEFGGLTAREAYIHVSEAVIKPRYGDDYLGQCALERLLDPAFDLKIISGVGFIDEVLPLIAAIGADRVLHLKVFAENNPARPPILDSRKELYLASLGVNEFEIVNRFDRLFNDQAVEIVTPFAGLQPARLAPSEFDLALA